MHVPISRGNIPCCHGGFYKEGDQDELPVATSCYIQLLKFLYFCGNCHYVLIFCLP